METILEKIAHGIRLLHQQGLSRKNLLILVNNAGMEKLKEAMNGDSCKAVVYVSRVFDIPVMVDELIEDEIMITNGRVYFNNKLKNVGNFYK